MRNLHYRKIWELKNGTIPKDEQGRSYEIHHIDGNRNNNSIENLQCLSIEEHFNIHYRQEDWLACQMISKRLNTILTPEMRLAINSEISNVKKGRSLSKETRDKISIANKGKVRSEEFKQNLSKLYKGVTRVGKKPSQETIEKRRKSNTGKTRSEETKQKISAAHKGKQISQECRLVLKKKLIGNQNRLGKPHSEEFKALQSQRMKGRKRGPYKTKTV